MGNNIVYLFGAGASYNAIPIVKDIPEKMSASVNQFLQKVVHAKGESIEIMTNRSDLRRQIKDRFKDVAEIIGKHYSIDTYARKLFLRHEDEELRSLKSTISAWMLIEQFLNGHKETRYDAFFASILNDLGGLPSNISVLSWNYDSLFENAAHEYFRNKSKDSYKKFMIILEKGGNITRTGRDRFNYIKLNGSATKEIFRNQVQDLIKGGNLIQTEELFNLLTERILFDKENFKSAISFAWERDDNNQFPEIVESAKSVISNADSIVIVGYSMPYYNRFVDKEIFSNLKPATTIFVQDPNPEPVMDRLYLRLPKNFHTGNINPIQSTDMFLLPDDMSSSFAV